MFAGIPGIARPPQFSRSAPPPPATEIVLAALGFAAVLIFGIVLALVWNRLNTRHPK